MLKRLLFASLAYALAAPPAHASFLSGEMLDTAADILAIVVLFLVPQGQFQKHLHTLAGIAKLLHKAEFRQALEQAPDAATMLDIIKGQGGKK